ncbi:MAG: hypothetical protein K2M12_02150, partial [Muribaculaceae bacterium]|nr:hypothetical protein [Muribaculaceae bacterium]
REKIGVMFGPTETTTGGNALKFYASVRIDIRTGSTIKDGEDVLGRRAKVKVVKNKVAPPFKRAEFDIMFGEGISRVGEILDLGVEFDIIRKSGSWFSYEGSKIAQGRDATIRTLRDNPELAEEIGAKITEALSSADKNPLLKAKQAAKKDAEAPAAAPAAAKEAAPAGDDLFDASGADDFSIEEDL